MVNLYYFNTLSMINNIVWTIFFSLWVVLSLINLLFLLCVVVKKRGMAKQFFSKQDIKFLFFSSVFKIIKYYLSKQNEDDKILTFLKKSAKVCLISIAVLLIIMVVIILMQVMLGAVSTLK